MTETTRKLYNLRRFMYLLYAGDRNVSMRRRKGGKSLKIAYYARNYWYTKPHNKNLIRRITNER